MLFWIMVVTRLFFNEEVAGVLGLKERYQTATVNVLNNEVETFQSMPLDVTTESLDGEFSKDIKVKTCPKAAATRAISCLRW